MGMFITGILELPHPQSLKDVNGLAFKSVSGFLVLVFKH